MMNFYKPENLAEVYELLDNLAGKKYLLAGGSDINILIRHRQISSEPVIMINHLQSLKGIKEEGDSIHIGAGSTISEINQSTLLRERCPFFAENLKDFASPLISSFATLGGNIAHASPTADTVPLLLVLNSVITASSSSGNRKIALKDFYTGYKKTLLRENELITAIEIPLINPGEYEGRYIKIGSRTALTIAKLSLAMILQDQKCRLAAGSLNEYPRRLSNVESYLNNQKAEYNRSELRKALDKDITPISDYRSDKEYRRQVCENYLWEFINSIYP